MKAFSAIVKQGAPARSKPRLPYREKSLTGAVGSACQGTCNAQYDLHAERKELLFPDE